MSSDTQVQTKSPELQALNKQILENAMTMRQEFARAMLDPRKDINKECGYPDTPTIQHYKELYEREGVATRVVDIFPEECWNATPEVLEDPEGKHTEWEDAWMKLAEEHNIYRTLLTVDQISGIGSYGILVLGINDGKNLDEPVEGVEEAVNKGAPVSGSVKHKILYIRPYDESVITILGFNTDRQSPRFGFPTKYQINLAQDRGTVEAVGSAGASTPEVTSVTVHWTRVIHIADNTKNSVVFGVPRMKDVLNRIQDVVKILGGSGEMFWKGGFPGLSFETHPDSMGTSQLTETEKKELRAEFDAYQNGLQRYLALVGVTAKSLTPQVADPTESFTTAIKAICIAKGIPYRIFMGSEEAQLAGEQDKKSWNERIGKRRVDYVTPEIVRPLVTRLMLMRVLEWKDKIYVSWPPPNKPTPKEQAEMAVKLTQAMAAYISGQVELLIPPLPYLTQVIGLSTEVAEDILKAALKQVALTEGDEDDDDSNSSAE